MSGNGTSNENRQTLMRVVALLLALAGLAERASCQSPAVRCLVLWLLRPAEAVAWAYVAKAMQQELHDPTDFRLNDDSAAEAMRLALSFRALAAFLASLPDELFAQWQVDISWQPALNELDCCMPALVNLLTAHNFQRRDSS